MCDCECGHHDWEDDESVHGELVYDLQDRPIRPLPKRQRLIGSPPPLVSHQPHRRTTVTSGDHGSDYESDHDVDEAPRGGGRTLPGSQEPVLDLRTAGEQEYGDGRAAYPPRRRTASPSTTQRNHPHDSNHTPAGSTSTKTTDSHDPSSSPDSPPTSPSFRCPSDTNSDEGVLETQTEFGLFGEDGFKIAKSLAGASSFSTAGLLGGLGLANLHPAYTHPPQEDDHYFEDEEDGDEDTYGVVDRSRPPVEPTIASTVSASALGLGGSNKKKRKVPGLNAQLEGSPSTTSAATSTTQTPGPRSHAPPPLPQTRTRAREEEPSPTRGDARQHSDDWVPLRAPVNPPTTAKAALAKLRIRPPHVSLCTTCSSTRRQRRKRVRSTCTKQRPLPLPSAPDFVPPAMPREGPPKLPPGSGLKGSKALKAAAKLAKEREKEKERIRKLFSGVRLVDLWDPEGKENPLPSVVSRMIQREIEKKRSSGIQRSSSKSPSGYPTPPASSDDGEADSKGYPWTLDPSRPELSAFEFRQSPPDLIQKRWIHLQDQKERVKAAKERAAKAREEEKQRKREKEEREKAEKAASVAAPPTPSSTPQRKTATQPAHPPTRPSVTSTTPRPPSQSTTSTNAPPPAPPPASALPSPPVPSSLPPPPSNTPRKAPPKKGRKKRSAHANAHNVHHRDNYVPSRLPFTSPPASTSTSHPHHNSNETYFGPTSWPASEEAIAAASPRQSHHHGAPGGGGGGGPSHFCDPDEWLCLFCEYQLFYGEEPAMYRAVRKRKGVLKVRKKAKDRASKATQGGAGGTQTASVPISIGDGGSGEH